MSEATRQRDSSAVLSPGIGEYVIAEKLRLSSYLLDDPNEGLVATLTDLLGLYEDDEGATGLLTSMLTVLEETEEGMVDLRVDHARLFVGPFEMLAPPYASLYLEDGGRVYGAVTVAIRKCYRRFGLVQLSEIKEPEDHISRLLEFLYYLAFEYARTGEEEYRDEFKRFGSVYVKSWYRRFFADMDSGATTGFYHLVAAFGSRCLPLD